MKDTRLPCTRLCLCTLVLLVAGLLAGCALHPRQQPIRDLAQLPQDLTAYLDPQTAHSPVLSSQQRNALASSFRTAFFSPWRRTAPSFKASLFAPYLRRALESQVFGENTLPRPRSWGEALQHNADLAHFPNASFPAITVASSSLRLIPTHKPMFRDFSLPGEGYPFDMAQNSAVWCGTPLFVAHLSADRSWALVETGRVKGWMPTSDLAPVDADLIHRYAGGDLLAVVRDHAPIFRTASPAKEPVTASVPYLARARVGMVLLRDPDHASDPDSAWRLLLPVQQASGRAVLLPATLSKDDATPFPLVLTPWNVAALGNQFMGQAYGWGGLFENRDCSSTLLDLFAPFGIYLPRNSKAQAGSGSFTDLSSLSPGAKESALLRQGRPLLTMIYKPGHIMLFAGVHSGRPVIFHNMWGIRGTHEHGPTPGRIVVGRTVVTTLTPGLEHPAFDSRGGSLLEGVSGMTALPLPE